jgi:hypothetical protein
MEHVPALFGDSFVAKVTIRVKIIGAAGPIGKSRFSVFSCGDPKHSLQKWLSGTYPGKGAGPK